MKRITATFIVTASFFLNGCANHFVDLPSYHDLLSEQTEQNGNACIRTNQIHGWGVLDDKVLSVDALATRKYYLVTTLFSCQDIQVSARVGFNSPFPEFCGRGRNSIVTANDECMVNGVFEFDSREEAFEAFETAELTRAELRKQHRDALSDATDTEED